MLCFSRFAFSERSFVTNGEEEINPITGQPWVPAHLDKLLDVIKSDETKPEPKTEDKKDD